MPAVAAPPLGAPTPMRTVVPRLTTVPYDEKGLQYRQKAETTAGGEECNSTIAWGGSRVMSC